MEMLTKSQASKYLGLTVNTLSYFITQGKLNAVKHGSGKTCRVFISKRDLDNFRENNKLLMEYYLLGAPEGYLSGKMIAKRLNIPDFLAKDWIKQGRFKDVTKLTGLPVGELRVVPLSSVIEYENKMKEIECSYIRVEETLQLLKINAGTLQRWIKEHKITGILKCYGSLYLPLNEINRLLQELEKEKEMVTLPQTVKLLGLPSKIISKISKNYRVSSIRGQSYLLSKANLEKMKQDYEGLINIHTDETSENFFNTKMLAERFKVPSMEIVRWINQGRFKNTYKKSGPYNKFNSFIIPKESVHEFEEFIISLKVNYIDVENAVRVFNVTTSTINNWIANKKFDGVIRWLNKSYIPIKSIEKLKEEMASQKDLFSLTKMCQEFRISLKRIKSLVQKGEIQYKVFNDKKLLDREELANALKNHSPKRGNSKSAFIWDNAERHYRMPDGYVTISSFSRTANISRSMIEKLIQSGKIVNTKLYIIKGKRYILIRTEEVESYLNKRNLNGKMFTSGEAATYLNIRQYTTVSAMVKNGYFPNAINENRKYLIPQVDLDEYIRLKALNLLPKRKSNNLQTYDENIQAKVLSKQEMISELLTKIVDISTPVHLSRTKEMYIKFSRFRIASLKGRPNFIINECNRIFKAYQTIIVNLSQNCFELSDEEVKSLLQNDSLGVSHRTLVNWFFHFSFREMGIKREKQFIIVPKIKKSTDKEMYTPEIYLEYVDYVKKVSIHTSEAIKSQHYSNMWLFTMMHLMDAWRPSDIVNELPDISTDELEVKQMDWFLTNVLSIEQAQQVINQVYIKTRHSSASKTKALLTFLVPLDMVLAAGTAFLINEIHRSRNQNSFLLQTLINQNSSAKTPTYQHLTFFKYNEKLKDFKSIVMIRSTMTYLFNSIVEEAPDPELALSYTMATRSHEKESTTSIYVQSTNRDGSINRVSLNLFNRGQFGWLFNFMIQLIFSNLDISPSSLEERSKLISGIRKDLSPRQLEDWAGFISKNNQSRETLISKLSSLSKSEVKDLFGEILRGERPSKDSQGQCFTFPNCEKTHIRSCYNCENFIPQVYLLIQLKYEIFRLVNSLKESKHQAIIIRDSEFLKKILTLLNEAVLSYGETYIHSFIDLIDIRKRVLEIKDKLFLDKN
ncbi:helix-turn-helix domain-containing protein [Paenibacillus germinis]|nr:helix-turn-helix domain-containing protein [Paenibacillus germinis]